MLKELLQLRWNNYFPEFDQFTKVEYEQLIEFVCTTCNMMCYVAL